MPIYSLREFGTVLRDFPAAAAALGEGVGRTNHVGVVSARSRRPLVMAAAALDRNDRVPRSATEVSRPRWPAWTAAIALHLAAVAIVLYTAQLLLTPAKLNDVEIALVFEPPATIPPVAAS